MRRGSSSQLQLHCTTGSPLLLLSCRAGLFDPGPENGRCAPQVNERVAYSTCRTPYFTNSGMADTLVVFFFSSQLAGPLNGSAYSVWAFFGVAAHPAPQRTPVGAGAHTLRGWKGPFYTQVALPPSKGSSRARAMLCARSAAPLALHPGCPIASPRTLVGC